MRIALAGRPPAPPPDAAHSWRRALVALLLVALSGFGVAVIRGPGWYRGLTQPHRNGSVPEHPDHEHVTADDATPDPSTRRASLRVTDVTGSFEITARPGQPVAPGGATTLDLALVNRRPRPLSVTSVVVRLAAVVAPGTDPAHPCDGRDFTVQQLSAAVPLVVPAGASVRLSDLGVPRAAWPRVAMVDRPVNQDGCKGASLRLEYAATGTSH
jgi:hypothetical protein